MKDLMVRYCVVFFACIGMFGSAGSAMARSTGFVLDLGMQQSEIDTSLDLIDQYVTTASVDNQFSFVATGEVVRFVIPAMDSDSFYKELESISAQMVATEYGNYAAGLERAIEIVNVISSSGKLVLLTNGIINTANSERVARYQQWAQLVLIPDATTKNIDLVLVAPSSADAVLASAVLQESAGNSQFELGSGDSFEQIVAALNSDIVLANLEEQNVVDQQSAISVEIASDSSTIPGETAQEGGLVTEQEVTLVTAITDNSVAASGNTSVEETEQETLVTPAKTELTTENSVLSSPSVVTPVEDIDIVVFSNTAETSSDSSQQPINDSLTIVVKEEDSVDFEPSAVVASIDDNTVKADGTGDAEPSGYLLYLLGGTLGLLVAVVGFFLLKRTRGGNGGTTPAAKKSPPVFEYPDDPTTDTDGDWLNDNPAFDDQDKTVIQPPKQMAERIHPAANPAANTSGQVAGSAGDVKAAGWGAAHAFDDMVGVSRAVDIAPTTVVVTRKPVMPKESEEHASDSAAPSVSELDAVDFDDDFAAFEKSINSKKTD